MRGRPIRSGLERAGVGGCKASDYVSGFHPYSGIERQIT